jgi:hypothetical protein
MAASLDLQEEKDEQNSWQKFIWPANKTKLVYVTSCSNSRAGIYIKETYSLIMTQ